MGRYFNIFTAVAAFLAGAAAKDWIVYQQIKEMEEWSVQTPLIMIHNEPITYLVYGIGGGWFVAGLLAAVTLCIDWYMKSVLEGKGFAAILSLVGGFVVGTLFFLPYAIINTKRYGIHIYAQNRQRGDLRQLKKDIAGTVFVICVMVVLLVIIRRTWYIGYKTILGGAVICAFAIFEGVRKIREVDNQQKEKPLREETADFEKTADSDRWDLLQSAMEGLSTEERLDRMCRHISEFIPYYLTEKERIGVTLEGGYFLKTFSNGTKTYLYVLRAKVSDGYISKKRHTIWEYNIVLGFCSPEDELLEDLTQEWMCEFMGDFYDQLYELYHHNRKRSIEVAEHNLWNMTKYTC